MCDIVWYSARVVIWKLSPALPTLTVPYYCSFQPPRSGYTAKHGSLSYSYSENLALMQQFSL